MVQGENSDDSHYETPWIYPWVNINSKWSNSAFSLLNDPLNNKTCCIADKNDSGKIQIWAVGKIPGKKQIKFISVQVRCSFTNYPLLGSIRLKEGEWESWEKFGNGPITKISEFTWQIDDSKRLKLNNLEIGFNPQLTGKPFHNAKIYWIRIKGLSHIDSKKHVVKQWFQNLKQKIRFFSENLSNAVTTTLEKTQKLMDVGPASMKFDFVILDGSNIARARLNSKENSSAIDVDICRAELMKKGIPPHKIYVIFGAGLKYHLKKGKNEIIFSEMLKEENVVEAPAAVDDDWFILKFAIEQNALIISNDRFRDYQEKYPQYGGIIKKITVKYSFIGKGLIFGENLDTLISSLI